jgi:hypothetical protein
MTPMTGETARSESVSKYVVIRFMVCWFDHTVGGQDPLAHATRATATIRVAGRGADILVCTHPYDRDGRSKQGFTIGVEGLYIRFSPYHAVQ